MQIINKMTRTDYDPEAEGNTSTEEEEADRWGPDATAAEVEAAPVLAAGQRYDMPNIPEKQSEIEMVIFRAVVGNEIEVLRDLHDQGASFNIHEPGAGNTPLHIACSIGMRNMAQFLVERGAKINVKNLERKTPMHLLVERRWADLAKWLAYQKADLYSKDKFGKVGPLFSRLFGVIVSQCSSVTARLLSSLAERGTDRDCAAARARRGGGRRHSAGGRGDTVWKAATEDQHQGRNRNDR